MFVITYVQKMYMLSLNTKNRGFCFLYVMYMYLPFVISKLVIFLSFAFNLIGKFRQSCEGICKFKSDLPRLKLTF